MSVFLDYHPGPIIIEHTTAGSIFSGSIEGARPNTVPFWREFGFSKEKLFIRIRTGLVEGSWNWFH